MSLSRLSNIAGSCGDDLVPADLLAHTHGQQTHGDTTLKVYHVLEPHLESELFMCTATLCTAGEGNFVQVYIDRCT